MNGSLAFTWSPNPVKFKGIRPEYQFYDTVDLIKNMSNCSYFEMYPELNVNGNIHYHGKLTIFDKIKWYKSVLPKLKYNGFVLIKSKNIDEKWDEYISKDKVMMEKLLNIKLPIEYNKLSKNKKDIIHYEVTTNLD